MKQPSGNDAVSSTISSAVTLLVIIFSLCILPSKAFAVPACPSPFELKQPSGKTFEARKRGDEWYNWVETKDGYGIYKNTETGNWEYYIPSDEPAKKDTKFRTGRKQDTKKRAIVSEVDPEKLGIPKGLRPPRKEDSRPWKPTKPRISPQITPHPSPLPQGERESLLPKEKRERLGILERTQQKSSTSTAVSGTMHLL